MNNFNKPIYMCSECKKIMEHLDDLLFIDEYSHKGFCSKECIEDFYLPLIKHFELIEHSLRAKHGVLAEIQDLTMIEAALIDSTLESPSEVFKMTNELNETFYNFIKHYNDFSIIVVSSVYRQEASFVFMATKTKSQALITEFRYGELLNEWGYDENEEDEIIVDLEPVDNTMEKSDEFEDEDLIFIQLLESKKSNILAEVLMNRKDDDIPFEDYSGYEFCFQETLDFPDEVFEKKDKEGDMVFTYIRAFLRDDETFYYIVTCLKRLSESDNVNVYPILALPTFDIELCQDFRGGTKLSGPLKN